MAISGSGTTLPQYQNPYTPVPTYTPPPVQMYTPPPAPAPLLPSPTQIYVPTHQPAAPITPTPVTTPVTRTPTPPPSTFGSPGTGSPNPHSPNYNPNYYLAAPESRSSQPITAPTTTGGMSINNPHHPNYVSPYERDPEELKKGFGIEQWGAPTTLTEADGSRDGGSFGLGMSRRMSSGSLSSLLNNLRGLAYRTRGRSGLGTTGGGSEKTSGNMDANALIAQNKFISENVTSFDRGGKLFEDVMNTGRMPSYEHGGYESLANEVLAQNQLSLIALNNQKNIPLAANGMRAQFDDMAPQLQRGIPTADAYGGVNQLSSNQPMANKGMKIKYQEGGNYPHNMYHPETGYKIVAKDEAAHNKLNAAGFGHVPKAAYGMKKRYTQGGRF